jgi:arylsulfatase A-like enzyme
MEDYLGVLLSVDDNIGRILDYLDQEGLTQNTIVIYTSDQGFYLGEHGWFDKRFMYEESLSMPLVMRYPREIEASQISDDIVLNLDFAPTILDYAGINEPYDMQGNSMRQLARGQRPENWRESMYYHYYEYPQGWHFVKKHYGIRTARYKLIHFYDDIVAWEFYDLQKDAHEINNIYDDPAYTKIIKNTRQELMRLRQEFGDAN